MGKYFSDSVETALQYIYYDTKGVAVRGKEGLELLRETADRGDGDAECVLARCLNGINYVWSGHHFPTDEKMASKLFRSSVLHGSAIGVLLAHRSGELSSGLRRQMPLSMKEAFDTVKKKAADGDPFCQYTIGNVYYWWDFKSIDQKNESDFPTYEAYHAYMKENITQCESWFWKAFRGGMYSGGNNLFNYYRKGDEDFVSPQPEKMKTVYKIGADIGYALHKYFHAQDLEEAGDMAGALNWYLQAARGGQPGLWHMLGKIYEEGQGIPQDRSMAFYCYEQGANQGETGCQDKLPRFYLEGLNTYPDYEKAYNLAWQCRENVECLYVLGRLYCEGLGRPADIPKGIEFFKQAGQFPEALAELKHYKKTLFGKWVRRR